jgi:hypothetical protein
VRIDEAVALRDVLSPERLAPYEAACAGDLTAALRLYAWNIEVSAAFHGLLGCLEAALRNAMSLRLAAHFGRDDWWTAPGAGLHWASEKKINEARHVLIRRGRPLTPDGIVAELSAP